MIKKVVTIVLTAVLIAVAVCGCSSGGNTPGTSVAVTENGAPETEPQDLLYADLPTGSYDGYTFRILQYESSRHTVNMDADEDDGTVIGGALWKRTMLVEDRLGVDVRLTLVNVVGEVAEKIEIDIADGGGYYDVFSNHSAHLAAQTLNGNAASYNDMSEIDLDKPWWDGRVTGHVAAGNGKIYMGFGYVNLTCYDSQCVIWFNKDLARDYQLGNVYQMIEDDRWTMDNFITMCRTFGACGDNLYGVGAYPYVGAPGLIYGCGVSFFEYNEGTSRYEFAGLTDKMVDVYSRMGAMLLDHSVSNLDWATYQSSFRSGETFAMCTDVSSMKFFRKDELNYGLAPFPKYNEEQEEYLSFTTNQIQGVCVSAGSTDKSRAATILENLAAESYRQMRSAYFEQIVNERLLRDEESKEILTMIYESPLVLPIEAVYDFKMPGNVFNFDGGGADMASRLDAVRETVNNALNDFYSWDI